MGDLTQDEIRALHALGYTNEWVEAGLLDKTLLAEQFQRMQSGGTQKTAKYRAKAVTVWLNEPSPVSGEQIDTFLHIMQEEPDSKLSNAGVAELIQSSRISLEQLEKIARSDEKLMRRHAVLIRRTYLIQQMKDGVTDDHINQAIDSKDAAIQTGLIRDPRLTRKHAEVLAKRGANTTIRDKAQKWAQDKQFWKGGESH